MQGDEKPWFVKITGPMRYQIKPYAPGGWLVMGLWAIVLLAVNALMFLPAVQERWWAVPLLSAAVTVPLLVFGFRTAVPIEEVQRRADERRRQDGGRRRDGR